MGFLLDSLLGIDMDFDGKIDAGDDLLFMAMMDDDDDEDSDDDLQITGGKYAWCNYRRYCRLKI